MGGDRSKKTTATTMGRRARDESDDEDVVSEEDEDEDDVDADSASDDEDEDEDEDEAVEDVGGSDSELDAEMAALASIQRERHAAKSGNKDAKTFANNAAGLDASIEGACVCVCASVCVMRACGRKS